MVRSIETPEVAKLIRKQLKSKFPGVKFTVKSTSYSGGSSIRVGWIDGPTDKRVQEVVGPFQGVGFDGMIDMQFYVRTWLLPDGSAVYGPHGGTTGSRGVYEPYDPPCPVEGAELISTGCWVHTERGYSNEFTRARLESFKEQWADGKYVQIIPAVENVPYPQAVRWEIKPWDSSIDFHVRRWIYDHEEEKYGISGGAQS